MKQVSVSVDNHQYPIFIGENLLSSGSLISDYIASDQVLIVTNPTVKELYLQPLKDALSSFQVEVFEMSDGEVFKSLETFEKIMQQMLLKGFRRNATIVALGGGVVGDLAGFSAACYQRGIPFVQVPTTLLAMVDSSVGGKTAVNHPLAKNMIGAFYQPQAVIADLTCLSSLPAREFSAGMAEVIKYGLITDFTLFELIEQQSTALLARDAKALSSIIERCCQIKAEVVNADEREQGVRAILNLGHTFGHAIEKAGNYRHWLHGEAVAIGTMMAFQLACRHGLIEQSYVERLETLFLAFNLPTRVPSSTNADELFETMRHDKKNISDKIRLIVPNGLGTVIITEQFDRDQITQAITSCFD